MSIQCVHPYEMFPFSWVIKFLFRDLNFISSSYSRLAGILCLLKLQIECKLPLFSSSYCINSIIASSLFVPLWLTCLFHHSHHRAWAGAAAQVWHEESGGRDGSQGSDREGEPGPHSGTDSGACGRGPRDHPQEPGGETGDHPLLHQVSVLWRLWKNTLFSFECHLAHVLKGSLRKGRKNFQDASCSDAFLYTLRECGIIL